jgi:hypothetical protein
MRQVCRYEDFSKDPDACGIEIRNGLIMAIYGIGSHFGSIGNVAHKFIADGLVGSNWEDGEAPDIHQIIISLKVGDIIFIKSCSASSKSIFISSIGIIKDMEILTIKNYPYIEIGRNVLWKKMKEFSIKKPGGKNNVRSNTIYQEFHPKVQAEIIKRLTV